MSSPAEYWMRGPIPEIPLLLQPVAHALLQSREEIQQMMTGVPTDLIWLKPAGLASPGFHLRHLSGVLDRLFTYAREEELDAKQLSYLTSEADPAMGSNTAEDLVSEFSLEVDKALAQLKATDEKTLLDVRGIGRKKIPTNVLGLLFHAAEHTQRHTGQLLVTVKVLLTSRQGKKF